MSLHGFLSDKSLIDSTRRLVNLEKIVLPCGYLDRDTIEFFVEPIELNDLREERLIIEYRSESGIVAPDQTVIEDVIGNILQQGIAHINAFPNETVTVAQYKDLDYLEFVNDTLPIAPIAIPITREMKLTIDYTKLTTDEQALIESMSPEEQQRLFNITEYLTYGTISTDTQTDINVHLSSNPEYLGYKANSVKLNTNHAIVYLYGGVNIHRFVPTSIEFQFIIGDDTVNVKFWISKEAFKSEYPNTTIINLVPPMDLQTMLDPSLLSNPISSAILSKSWTDMILQPEFVSRDQSGMHLFDTRYIYNGETYTVTFGLIYRGRVPDAMESRIFIAEYLLNSGIGTRGLWEIILPDIFYHSAFVLIPFYHNRTTLVNADIYPSIIKATDLLAKIDTVVNKIPRANDPYRELMTAAYDKYLIGVAPADVNESSSLLNLYPTYRDFSTTDNGFSEMTSDTREFSIRLNQALSVAAGETNLLTVNRVTMGDLVWTNFVFNHGSFNILTKESYYQHFNLE